MAVQPNDGITLKLMNIAQIFGLDVLDEPCSKKFLDRAGIMFQGPG